MVIVCTATYAARNHVCVAHANLSATPKTKHSAAVSLGRTFSTTRFTVITLPHVAWCVHRYVDARHDYCGVRDLI